MVLLAIPMSTVLCRACALDCVTEWKKLVAEVGWRGLGVMNTPLSVAASLWEPAKIPKKNNLNLRGGITYTQGPKLPSYPPSKLSYSGGLMSR